MVNAVTNNTTTNSAPGYGNVQLEKELVGKTPAQLYEQFCPGGKFDSKQAEAFRTLSPQQQQHVISSLFSQAQRSGDAEAAWNALQVYGNLVQGWQGPGVGAILRQDLQDQAGALAATPGMADLGTASYKVKAPTEVPTRYKADVAKINDSTNQLELRQIAMRAANDKNLLACLTPEQKGKLVLSLFDGGTPKECEDAAAKIIESAGSVEESDQILVAIGGGDFQKGVQRVYNDELEHGQQRDVQASRDALSAKRAEEVTKFANNGACKDMAGWLGRAIDVGEAQAAADAPVGFDPLNAYSAQMKGAALDAMDGALRQLGIAPNAASMGALVQQLDGILAAHPELDQSPVALVIKTMSLCMKNGDPAQAAAQLGYLRQMMTLERSAMGQRSGYGPTAGNGAMPPANYGAMPGYSAAPGYGAVPAGYGQSVGGFMQPTANVYPFPGTSFNPTGKVLSPDQYFKAANALIDPDDLVGRFRRGDLPADMLTGDQGRVTMMMIQDRISQQQAITDALRNITQAYNEQIKKTIDAIR